MFDTGFLAALVLLFEASVAGGNVEAPLHITAYEGGSVLGVWETVYVDSAGAEAVSVSPETETSRLRWGRVEGEQTLYAVSASRGDVVSLGAVSLSAVLDAIYSAGNEPVRIDVDRVPVSASGDGGAMTVEGEVAADAPLSSGKPGESGETGADGGNEGALAPAFRIHTVMNTVLVSQEESGRLFVAVRTVP